MNEIIVLSNDLFLFKLEEFRGCIFDNSMLYYFSVENLSEFF